MNTVDKSFLKKYEVNLKTAVYSDYSRNLPSAAVQRMEQIYYNETGKVLKTNTTCAHCVLKTLKEIGQWAFENNILDDGKEKV